MKKLLEMLGYGTLFLWVLIIDRVTKYWVLTYVDNVYQVTDFLSFDFVLNRGISWGMFHAESDGIFWLLSLMILGVFMLLVSFAYRRWHEANLIIGEVLVIAGAFSNIIDRMLYRGVVDFIVISWGDYFSFPAFNIADACIVVGVFMMLTSVYRNP